MKKFIITLLLAAMPLVTFAQKEAFAKFEGVEGIESITINKKMFEILASVDSSSVGKDVAPYLDTASGLDYVNVFTTSDKKYKKQLKDAVGDYLKTNPLQELISVTDNGSKIKVYVKQGSEESIITEGLVFIENNDKKEEAVLVSFTGNINLNDIKDFKGLKGEKGCKGPKGAK
jgi:hypothetical protein